MKQKEIANLFAKMIVNSKVKKRTCLYPGCSKPSINSHLLQRNGILSRITENNHLNTLVTNFQTKETKFRLTGWKDAFTFQGYCQEHDHSLFQRIESANVDFAQEIIQLLFTYRAIFNELRKKEILVEGFNRAIQSRSLEGYIDKTGLKEAVKNNSLGERDLRRHLQTAHENLNKSTSDFGFYCLRTGKVPVCISAAISIETAREMLALSEKNPESWLNDELSVLVINYFPLEHENILLAAFSKKNSANLMRFIDEKIKPIAEDTSGKFLSDLIIAHTETWACSPSFYANHVKPNEREILHWFHRTSLHMTEPKIPVNIFQHFKFGT